MMEYRFVDHVYYIGAVNDTVDLTKVALGDPISPVTCTT